MYCSSRYSYQRVLLKGVAVNKSSNGLSFIDWPLSSTYHSAFAVFPFFSPVELSSR